MNRLASATSPYLLQHRDNPVDWWPWGEEAFEEARRRDVPVLLSVGYAACHWCHVMAHESFEDTATAADLNAGFVAIKVDREERPDVDATYLAATVALTGHGGWPMTAFLTPAGTVFHAGTYYPPQPRPGTPSFRQLLAAVSQAWRERRDEVIDAGARIAAALAAQHDADPGPAIGAVGPAAPVPPSEGDLAAAVRRAVADHDADHGGFGGAPKFPPSMVLLWLLRHAARAGTDDPGGSGAQALTVATTTLRAMAAGGLHDQVEGGFARYTVDAAWVVPHFEKMLYANALLARAYLHWWRLTGDPTGRRVAASTCDWMVRRMRTDSGGLASALDADTDGVEGLTYVWTPDQLVDTLGVDDGHWAARVLGVTERGTFEHGTSTLRLLVEIDAGADADAVRWHSVRARLAEARAARPQPLRDDKVVAAWNGLAIAALAEAGALLDRPDLLDAAREAADAVLRTHVLDGSLRRVSRDGAAGTPAAVLEDHGDLTEGLLTLAAVTGEARWSQAAGPLVRDMLTRFVGADSRWRDTPTDDVDPVLRAAAGDRPADPGDNAYPSGPAAAAGALLTWSGLTGDGAARAAAERTLDEVRRIAARQPRFAGWGLAVAEAMVDGPREVAVVGPPEDDRTRLLWRAALSGTAPGLVVAVGAPGDPSVPALLAGRPLVAGAPVAYPCRGQVCDLPTSDPGVVACFALTRQW
jgi:uncharacterized protein